MGVRERIESVSEISLRRQVAPLHGFCTCWCRLGLLAADLTVPWKRLRVLQRANLWPGGCIFRVLDGDDACELGCQG